MKKFFMFLAVVGLLAFTANIASAQDQPAATDAAATEEVAVEEPAEMTASDLLKGTNQDVPLHQVVKTYFIQGGPGFMSLIVLCLILGLALAIERILYLSFSKTNAKKLTSKIEETLRENGLEVGVEKALDILVKTQRPINEVAQKVGFSSSNYFYPVFKKLIGVTPAEYRLNKKSLMAEKT